MNHNEFKALEKDRARRYQTITALVEDVGRLELDVEAWVTNVEACSGLFHRVVGKIHRLGEIARATGRSWLQGQRGVRQLYAGVT